ncbi:hypothetical protein QOZ80_5AG0369510 [Eleusine coracana subsp. coracana]|nr:hypothetical protein QOZ80_5AG0369510 [Eleusine coracana subsp. coracana]
MGRRKFRFSDMMPNSWFYKLRDMRRAGGAMYQSSSSSSCLGAKGITQPAGTPRPVPAVPMPHRSSYYFASRDRVLQPAPAPQPPTRAAAATEEEEQQQLETQAQSPARSYRRRHKVGPVGKPEPAPVAHVPDATHRHRRDTCVGRDGDVGKQLKKPAKKTPSSTKDVFTGKVIASETDIIFDLHADDDVSDRVLRPIATRPAAAKKKERHVVLHAATPRPSSVSEQGGKGNSGRRSSVSLGGRRLKTRANSPRLAAAAASPRCRKKAPPAAAPPPLAESFAVVKASVDPRRDFRESMEEMIAEKGIRGAGDLEDLLACYLALNADEHHGLIVEVFEEIWASLAGVNP